jgi:hypothetical protein
LKPTSKLKPLSISIGSTQYTDTKKPSNQLIARFLFLIYKRYKLITKAIGWGIEGIDAIKTIEAIEMDKYGFAFRTRRRLPLTS